MLAVNEQKNNKAQQHHNCFIISLRLAASMDDVERENIADPNPDEESKCKNRFLSYCFSFKQTSKTWRLHFCRFGDKFHLRCVLSFKKLSSHFVAFFLLRSRSPWDGGGGGRSKRRFSCLFFQWFNLLIYYHAWVASSGAGDKKKTGSGSRKMTLNTNNCFLARGNIRSFLERS